MRALPLFLTLAFLATGCADAPDMSVDIDVVMPVDSDEPVTPSETDEPTSDSGTPADTDSASADTDLTPTNAPCDWTSDSSLSLFDLPAFVAVQSGEEFILEIPMSPSCGDVGITNVSIDGRFTGEMSWLQTFQNEPLAADSVGYWKLEAFDLQYYTGRYDGIGYSPGIVSGSADYLMTWSRDIYSSPGHSTRIVAGQTEVMKLTFPNLSQIFDNGRIAMTVWIHFKDLQTGYDSFLIDQMDLVIVD